VISGNSTFLTFDGPQIRWSYEKDKTTDYDIVVFHVHQEYRSNLKPFYRFIQTDDFSTVDAYSKLTLYAFVGFPHSKNRPQRSNGKDIEAKSHYFVVREFADLSKIDSKDKRKEVHVAFFAPLKKITDIQFRRKAPPNPQGMSGCAVWKIKIDEQTGWVNTCHFVGIGIEHTPSAQAFIATKSEWIYYAISELKRKMSDT